MEARVATEAKEDLAVGAAGAAERAGSLVILRC